MTPVWSPQAIDDLVSLRGYVSEDDPAAAQRVALHIIHNVEVLLAENPQMGRSGRAPGTRELVIRTRLSSQGDALQILRVFHAARSWPERL